MLFIGTDEHLHELFIIPGAACIDHDLTKAAHAVAPNIGAALDAYRGSDSSRHVDF